jgi:outer membrane protein assembly factor BamD
VSSKTCSVLVAVLLAACAGNKDNIDITKPVTGEAATNAQRAYQRGLEERKSQNFIEATRFFEWVRNNFPYSQYAALSELALADMAFDRDDLAAAAAAYQEFVKSHPSHPRADYAAFRVGLAHYMDKPSDWFLLPPSYEKDQAPIRSALDSFQRFTLAYPKSEFVSKAKDMIAECRERLAAHEGYVAEFYTKRGGWRGAAGRWMGIADNYGDLQGGRTHGDALWRAALAWRSANDPASEKAVLQRLIQEAPDSPHRREAEQLLKELPAAPPPAQPPVPEVPKAASLPPTAPVPAEKPPPADQPPQPVTPDQPKP